MLQQLAVLTVSTLLQEGAMQPPLHAEVFSYFKGWPKEVSIRLFRNKGLGMENALDSVIAALGELR
jgi:hypothetical protein